MYQMSWTSLRLHGQRPRYTLSFPVFASLLVATATIRHHVFVCIIFPQHGQGRKAHSPFGQDAETVEVCWNTTKTNTQNQNQYRRLQAIIGAMLAGLPNSQQQPLSVVASRSLFSPDTSGGTYRTISACNDGSTDQGLIDGYEDVLIAKSA